MLVLGLSAGVWAQGGYHGPGRLVLVVAVSAAGVLALARGAASPQRLSGGPPQQRDELVRALMVLGVVVAATGWIGVVRHREPWALTNAGRSVARATVGRRSRPPSSSSVRWPR